jgi:hypothetical protein
MKLKTDATKFAGARQTGRGVAQGNGQGEGRKVAEQSVACSYRFRKANQIGIEFS